VRGRLGAFAEHDAHAVGAVDDPIGRLRAQVDDEARDLRRLRAELSEPHLAHGRLADLELPHRRARADVGEVDHEPLRVREQEILVLEAAVGLDREGHERAHLVPRHRGDARRLGAVRQRLARGGLGGCHGCRMRSRGRRHRGGLRLGRLDDGRLGHSRCGSRLRQPLRAAHRPGSSAARRSG
jgi:hypothetical protein